MKLRIDNDADEISYWLWCPGCDEAHRITNSWQFDGNIESPTFSPSILVQGGEFDTRCHSFIRQGEWEYLGDCTHTLANQKVPMVDLPKWLAEEKV
ncbi:DUF6527 family protein [Pseudarthrobacter sp. HLT3-5]|uniref:DUF6527 family protein n=1 Tax=Pseudarthrobacter cellobiosi TaxID=2953654 RepID=UPI00208EC3C2|nr:DUF6527 family protein [Pseudarthrobacter sp. HLT3-5]MCO4274302.1 DUF6527 family protein [Pseudarthrobacter sp. HLT3-5]